MVLGKLRIVVQLIMHALHYVSHQTPVTFVHALSTSASTPYGVPAADNNAILEEPRR